MQTQSKPTTIAPIATIFSFNADFIPMALDGLSLEELWRSPASHTNPMLWVAGHIVHTRATVLQMLGESVDTGWGTLFDRGATLGEPGQYPSADQVTRTMRDLSPRLTAALSALTDEQLNRPSVIGIPGLNTLSDELAFFALHDSYHVGQLAYIRKALGYPGLAG